MGDGWKKVDCDKVMSEVQAGKEDQGHRQGFEYLEFQHLPVQEARERCGGRAKESSRKQRYRTGSGARGRTSPEVKGRGERG